jgi:hypothetical protein
MLFDFIHYTVDTYKRNNEDDFLRNYYQSKTERITHTAVSDMDLIYLWVKENKVPYINSNSSKFEFGIDHNISVISCEDDEFKSFADRKRLRIWRDSITCFLKSGKEKNMDLLHFQGAYKPILKRFYSGRIAKFIYFSSRNNYRHSRKIFRK